MRMLSMMVVAISIIFLSACQTDPYKDQVHENPTTQAEKDQNAIIEHLKEKGVDAQRTESGIYYTIEQEGNGTHPTAEDYVKVHYKGTLLDGTVFDSSYDRGEPTSFPLSGVVKGWTEGIPLLSEGGKGTLYLPSGLAYGAQSPSPKIPANSPLVFEVELLEVLDAAAYEKSRAAATMNMLNDYLAKAKEKTGEEDEKAVLAYLEKKNLKDKVQKTEEGLYYIIEDEGEGDERPSIMSTATFHFKGMDLNGKVLEDSEDINEGNPITVPLTQVMPGWSLGLQKIGKGGKMEIFVPSYMGYGEQGRGDQIPPKTSLVYELELIDFK